MRISDWSSDVCSSDLSDPDLMVRPREHPKEHPCAIPHRRNNLQWMPARPPRWSRYRSFHPHFHRVLPGDKRKEEIAGSLLPLPNSLPSARGAPHCPASRSAEHTSELQSIMRISS